MSFITIYLEDKNFQPQATIELKEGPIPRMGEVIHAPGRGYGGMDWFLVEDVRYIIQDNQSHAEVTAHAISSHAFKGLKAARYDYRNREGWLDFEPDPLPEAQEN